MTRDEALKKIKKCLALARGASDHEAAAAMRQAQKLMSEYDLSEMDVSLENVYEVEARASSAAANAWELRLVRLIAEAFGCDLFARMGGRFSGGRWVNLRTWVFVGVDAGPTVAGYACDVLVRQCAKQRLAHIGQQPRNCKQRTKTTRGDMFAIGWVAAVATKVPAADQSAEHKQLLRTYITQKHPDMVADKVRNTTTDTKQSRGHLEAGYRAGQAAQLHQGLGGAAPVALIGM